MSNYSNQTPFGTSDTYTQDYSRGNNKNTNNGNNLPYNVYTTSANNVNGAYGAQQAGGQQLDLTQVASLIAQNPQALSMLLALQVQQLGTNQSLLSGTSASNIYSSTANTASYKDYNESPSTRVHGTSNSEYYSGRGGGYSDRSDDRRGRDDRASSGHGRRDREPSSNYRSVN